jgi:hypothetical protein
MYRVFKLIVVIVFLTAIRLEPKCDWRANCVKFIKNSIQTHIITVFIVLVFDNEMHWY